MPDCSICLLQIGANDLRTTSCRHEFHRDCLQQWLDLKSSCPLCRSEQLPIDKNYNIIYKTNYNNIIDNYIIIF
jgi:hypothetical protein